MNKCLLWLLALLIMTSCSKNLSRFNVNPNKFVVNSVDYEYLTLKSKIKYEDGKNKHKAIANIRIKNDSIIWFSITPGLGIEAFRGVITQDSVLMIDKIKKEYVRASVKDYTDDINFSYNLNLLESILVGNLIWPVDANDEVEKLEDHFLIDKKFESMTISNFISQSSMKLEKIEATSDTTDTSMKVKYQTFQEFSGRDVPTLVDIRINYISPKDNTQKMSNITIEHSKVEIDKPQRFSFNISKKYKRK